MQLLIVIVFIYYTFALKLNNNEGNLLISQNEVNNEIKYDGTFEEHYAELKEMTANNKNEDNKIGDDYYIEASY